MPFRSRCSPPLTWPYSTSRLAPISEKRTSWLRRAAFGGVPARLKTIAAGQNVSMEEDGDTVTISSAAAAMFASLVAGENVQLTETPEARVRIAVPELTTARADIAAVGARVEALENEGDDIPGRLKVDDSLT